MFKFIDLSQRIEDNMPVYPGDIKTNLFQSRYLSVNGYNDHRLDIGMHAGTHVDSPMHLTGIKEYISELPLESFAAEGCILDVRDEALLRMKAGYEDIIKEKSIVLLYTGFDRVYGSKEYYEEHPCLDEEFCKFLIGKKIKMLGIDTPSPDKYPFPIHKLLFDNKVYIMENLTNLDKLLGEQSFEIFAFPLKIKADSSMVRAVARMLI